MNEKKIRALRPDEIEVRVAQIGKNGYQLLLYKNSRCDKRILDEVFGPMRWKDEYREVKGALYCTISVWDDELKQWIAKEDCGSESNMEKKKGEASDAFKRAGTAWGIGRELYTRIFIWVQGGVQPQIDVNGKQVTKNGKPQWELINRFMTWHVEKLDIDDKNEKIIGLTICDDNGVTVFSYGTCARKSNGKEDKPISPSDLQFQMENIDMATIDQIKNIKAGCTFVGISEAELLKRSKLKRWEDATFQQAQHVIHYINQKADIKTVEEQV